MSTLDHPLADAVSVGVVMALAELAKVPAEQRPVVLARWRAAAVDVLPYRGDILLYGADRRATRAQRAEVVGTAFAALARGLAALATLPGGVPFAGRLFCAAHSPAGATAQHPCPRCLAELEEVPTTAPGGQP